MKKGIFIILISIFINSQATMSQGVHLIKEAYLSVDCTPCHSYSDDKYIYSDKCLTSGCICGP